MKLGCMIINVQIDYDRGDDDEGNNNDDDGNVQKMTGQNFNATIFKKISAIPLTLPSRKRPQIDLTSGGG